MCGKNQSSFFFEFQETPVPMQPTKKTPKKPCTHHTLLKLLRTQHTEHTHGGLKGILTTSGVTVSGSASLLQVTRSSSGLTAITSSFAIADSKPSTDFNSPRIFQHVSIGSTFHQICFRHFQATPWKHNSFFSFQMPQHTVEDIILTTINFLLHNQHLATNS